MAGPSLPPLTPGMGFDEAAEAVLAYLREHVPMGFWSVTRVENGTQTYLYLDSDTNPFGLAQGGGCSWEDSVCRRMVAGEGPKATGDIATVPSYASAPGAAGMTIGAYAGMPIQESDGSLYGVLCGVDDRTRPAEFAAHEALLTLLTSLLGMVLAADRARDAALERARMAELAAETDLLTGLFNRRAWERLVHEEEIRFARLADPTVVVLLDLDRLKEVNDRFGHAAGDDYICAAANGLRGALGADHPVARLGGDEFGTILRGCQEADGARQAEQLTRALASAGVSGSVGWAPLRVVSGFPGALRQADAAMYAAKRARQREPDSISA